MNKIAIITGAGNGMGRSEAILFAQEGAIVIVADIDIDAAERVQKEIASSGGIAKAVKADVTRQEDWNSIVNQALQYGDQIDILVNNAGISASAFEDNDSLSAWDKMMDVNAKSVFIGTLSVVPHMKAHGGSIVNISSIMGIVGGSANHPSYHASKAAVRLYTKAAACRYGKFKIRVNSVHPGIMPPMISSRNSHPEKGSFEKIIDDTPLKRTGEVEEVALGVLFLASDESSFITGTELVIDGGLTAR